MDKLNPQDIETLIQQFQASSWNEMRLTAGETELLLSKNAEADFGSAVQGGHVLPSADPAPATSAAQAAYPDVKAPGSAASVGALPDGWQIVRAPSLGTFYRSPKPGAPAYCEVGQAIEEDTELCLIEVMKLFTTVRAKVKGVVREVRVRDGEMVEFDQPLFVVEPHA